MDDAIDQILAARRERRVLAPLGALAPADVAAGYALQHRLAERLGALPPAGFKLGATAAAMQAYLGLDGPAAGFMVTEGLFPDGATLAFAELQRPGVECEIAIRLGRDLPPEPCDEATARDAVSEVFAAIEIVENRYGDLAVLGTPTLIADQVFHAAAVLSAPITAWRDLDLGATTGTLSLDGEVQGSAPGRALLGHPLNALRWLAASGAAVAFGGLRAGQVVLLGSVIPPVWLDRPGRVTVAFDGLGSATVNLA